MSRKEEIAILGEVDNNILRKVGQLTRAVTRREIGEALRMPPTATHRFVENLIRAGHLVEKRGDTGVLLTDKGRQLVEGNRETT